MTFFDAETEELDLPTIKRHAVWLVRDGLAGLVTMGSNGVAVHCTREEKAAATRATRDALDEAGFQTTLVVIGATEGSVKGVIELCKQAHGAGADYCLLLPAELLPRPDGRVRGPRLFRRRRGREPPSPLVLYNYPGAVPGH